MKKKEKEIRLLSNIEYQMIISKSGIPDKVRMASPFENSTARYSKTAPSLFLNEKYHKMILY